MSAVPPPFWLVSCSCYPGAQSKLMDDVMAATVGGGLTQAPPTKFDVPDLKFGGFDNLVKLSDDLSKQDGQVEAVLRRVERQLMDLDPKAERKVVSQRSRMNWDHYIRTFQWDDSKFPRSRPINDSMVHLMASVQRLDEEVRNRGSSYGELKTTVQNNIKGDSATLMTKGLIDVLNPDVATADQFVSTEHLQTVCVVVPRSQDKEWLKAYENMDTDTVSYTNKAGVEVRTNCVVPQSTMKWDKATDKDGAMLFRAVIFRSGLEGFKKACREKKFAVREFEFDAAKYAQSLVTRANVEAEMAKQESFLIRVCQAAFSDALISWMHVKGFRIFVESCLRSGRAKHAAEPNFTAFILQPVAKANKMKRLHADLSSIATENSNQYGQQYTSAGGAAADDDDVYHPYVFNAFSPVTL